MGSFELVVSSEFFVVQRDRRQGIRGLLLGFCRSPLPVSALWPIMLAMFSVLESSSPFLMPILGSLPSRAKIGRCGAMRRPSSPYFCGVAETRC